MNLPNQINHERSIGAIFSSTIYFIQLNWKPLLRSWLIFCRLFILPTVVFNYYYPAVAVPHIKGQYNAELALWTNYRRYFTENAIIRSILGKFSTTAVGITTLTYIKFYMQDGIPMPTQTIYGRFKRSYITYFIIFILADFIFKAGMLLFVVPGIYLTPVIGLIIAAMLLEDQPLPDAVRRGFKLIKDNWWFSFGSLICTGLIAGIPLYIIHKAVSHITSSPIVKSVAMIPFDLAAQCLQIIPFIGLAFCYYALKGLQPAIFITGNPQDINPG